MMIHQDPSTLSSRWTMGLSRFASAMLALVLGLLIAAPAAAQRKVEAAEVDLPRTEAWPEEVVEAFSQIPVQDAGRVKPLSTVAGFRMLNTNGKRSFEVPAGSGLPTAPEKLTPTTWYLDAMFFPEQARTYEVFLVDDNAVLEAMGLRFEGRKRRDRYSFNQLMAGRGEMEELAKAIYAKEAAERTRVETQLLVLRNNLDQYEMVERAFSSLGARLGPEAPAGLVELYPEAADGGTVSVQMIPARWPEALDWQKAAAGTAEGDTRAEAIEPLWRSVLLLIELADYGLALFPADDLGVEKWQTAGEVLERRLDPARQDPTDQEVALFGAYAELAGLGGDMEALSPAILAAFEAGKAAATRRGEFEKVPMEVSYYKRDYFTKALVFFLLGFLTVALSWLRPGGVLLPRLTWFFVAGGLASATVGVTVRCLLLERPPVATLYETILFITSIAVLVCLVAERLTKERVALALGTTLGAAGMFLAMRYEAVEAASQGDTMGGLIAVLNTNFWLATHVTTVTMGYSAGLLAAALGHVWLVLRLGRGLQSRGAALTREQSEWFRRFGRMTYGVLCFGLLFSVVGTILGGVWANDSWGRFWGWDPKENGALMIVLYELVILHSRMGGYIKDFGVAVLAVIGGSIVAFSWFHVNQLGVGLHSYGFTDGVLDTLWTYYYLVAAFVAVSLGGWYLLVRPRRNLGAA
ncbi:MAG: cytochrome c biogenesis protein CcsA [Planctomycetota bacterium]|nr:cytochrome c biogenesis protein CcsA [Planctomycetota bacterium]MDG1983211.1 cytochrome c biogenesis protein CcsA [Planctomycetota bacterium]